MKKLICILVTVTLMWLTAKAEASYIYDWVSTSLNPGDCGSRVEASWFLTDDEYRAGVFSTLNVGNFVTSSVELFDLSGNSFMKNVGLWGAEYTGVSGILNNAEDKTRILAIYFWESWSPALFFAEATGDIGWQISANRMWGNAYAWDYVEWDRNGEWVLREPDNAVVPEPSSVLLLIIGAAAVAIKSRRAARKGRICSVTS